MFCNKYCNTLLFCNIYYNISYQNKPYCNSQEGCNTKVLQQFAILLQYDTIGPNPSVCVHIYADRG